MEELELFFKRSAQAWRHRCAADDYRMTSESLEKAALKYTAGASEALAGLGVAETGMVTNLGPASRVRLGRSTLGPAVGDV